MPTSVSGPTGSPRVRGPWVEEGRRVLEALVFRSKSEEGGARPGEGESPRASRPPTHLV